MEADGTAAHGEADFIAAYAPSSVLDAGCGMGRVAIELEVAKAVAEGFRLPENLVLERLNLEARRPDLKPVMREFLPREAVRQPAWVGELMQAYWNEST